MIRSKKKAPFISYDVLKQSTRSGDRPIYTKSRASTIFLALLRKTVYVHNGKNYIPVIITEYMLGHKLGEFSPTRKAPSHKKGPDKTLKAKEKKGSK